MNARSIQVVRLSSLGDVILCEPAVAGLREAFPDASLQFVTRPRYADVYRAHPGVDEVVDLAQALAQPADLVVDLHNRRDTARLARRAAQSVRWRKRGLADLPRAALGLPLHREYRDGPHQVERIAAALERAGYAAADRPPQVHLDPDWPCPPPVDVVLLPAASHAVKRWPHFAPLAARLVADGLRVAVLVGPGEAADRDAVIRAAPGATPWSANLAVGPAAAALAAARVAVGNDTGLLHLAAAVGTRVVGLFGPTPPGRWGPRNPTDRIVSLDADCAPCSDFGGARCRRPRRACLDDLEPSVVHSATLSALSASHSRRTASRYEKFA